MNAAHAPVLRAELTRKAIHLTSAVLPIAWGLGYVSREDIRAALAAALGLAVLIEWLRRRSLRVRHWFNAAFGKMLRPHERVLGRANGATAGPTNAMAAPAAAGHAAGRSALTGATWLVAAMLACVLALPAAAAITALWAAAVGDAFAAIIGRLSSRGEETGSGKTMLGSIACALATAVGVWWLGHAIPVVAIGVGTAAALAERPVVALDDNVRVAAAAGLSAWGLGVA